MNEKWDIIFSRTFDESFEQTITFLQSHLSHLSRLTSHLSRLQTLSKHYPPAVGR